MRSFGTLHPSQDAPAPPDTVNTLLIAASSGQAMDWPDGTDIARLSGISTAGAAMNFFANLFSTAAAVPTTGSSASSTGVIHPVMGSATFQIPGTSTGFSVAALSSGYVQVECWKR